MSAHNPLKLFKITFKEVITNEITYKKEVLADTNEINIAAFSVEQAVRCLQKGRNGNVQIYNTNQICEIHLIDGNVVSRIIKDNGNSYINDLMKNENYVNDKLAGNLAKTIWGNASK